MQNRRGSSENYVLIFAFVFLLVLIFGGIWAGTTVYFGEGYDFRKVDAEVLNYLIRKCILERDLEMQFKEKSITGFYEICSLNEEIIAEGNNFRISVNGEEKIFTGGDFEQCDFKGRTSKFPECSRHEIDLEGKMIKVETLSMRESRRVNG